MKIYTLEATTGYSRFPVLSKKTVANLTACKILTADAIGIYKEKINKDDSLKKCGLLIVVTEFVTDNIGVFSWDTINYLYYHYDSGKVILDKKNIEKRNQ